MTPENWDLSFFDTAVPLKAKTDSIDLFADTLNNIGQSTIPSPLPLSLPLTNDEEKKNQEELAASLELAKLIDDLPDLSFMEMMV